MAFIGDLPEDRLALACSAARDAAAQRVPFDVALDRIGRFPARGRPNVVWLGAGEGADDLLALGGQVRDALRARGLPFDDKPFRAHVTLARVKRDIAPAAVPELVAALGAVAALELPSLRFRADALHVVESILSPRGPRYSSVQAVPLGPGGSRGGGNDDHAGRPGRDGSRDGGPRVPQAPR